MTPRGNTGGNGCQTGGKCQSSNPGHRGSLLTTLTSLDNTNNVMSTRPSLAPLQEYRLATVELLPTSQELKKSSYHNEQNDKLSNSSFL